MKRILSTLIIISLLLNIGAINVMAKSKFPDVPDNAWYISDLEYVLNDSRQILSGHPDGTYKPEDTLTVGQFIKCIILAANIDVEPNSNSNEYWARPYIDRAKGLMYVLDGEFKTSGTDPYADFKRPITRGEMSRIVVRAVKDITGLHDYRDLDEIEKLVKDYDSIPSQLKTYVLKSYDIGIITGYPDGNFKADDTLTRAQAVTVIRRAIDVGARKSPSLYGVEVIEGIEFDRERDIVPDRGSMELHKQEEFVMKFFNSLKFYTDDNGKSYVEGYVPNLPSGFEWSVSLMVFYNDGSHDTYFVGEDTLEEIRLYVGRPFIRELIGTKEQSKHIIIDAWIENSENKAEDGRFFLRYPAKTLKKFDVVNKFDLDYDWEEVFGQW